MRPYAGTPIESALRSDGRLRGTRSQPDYRFLDRRLDTLYDRLQSHLGPWVHGSDSVSHNLNLAWHEFKIIERLFPPLSGTGDYRRFLRKLTSQANDRIFSVIEAEADACEQSAESPVSIFAERKQAKLVLATLTQNRDAYVFGNQDRMLQALHAA
jgi:hypothetical protein